MSVRRGPGEEHQTELAHLNLVAHLERSAAEFLLQTKYLLFHIAASVGSSIVVIPPPKVS